MSWADAMGLVVLEGLVILVLVLTGFRKAVFAAVPRALKTAISVGIGLFIAFIGLVDAGFVRRNPDVANTPVPVGFGIGGDLQGWPVLVFVVGLLAIIVMMVRKVKGAILIGIVGATVLAIIIEAIADIGPSFTPPDKVESARLGAQRARASPTRSSTSPTSGCSATSACSDPSSAWVSSPRCCSPSRCCSLTSSTRSAP